MISIKFADVVSMDYEPTMRLLVLARVTNRGRRRKARHEEWWAMVLVDHTWPVGHLVTVAPDVSGFKIIPPEED